MNHSTNFRSPSFSAVPKISLRLFYLAILCTLFACDSPTSKPKAKVKQTTCTTSNEILNNNPYDSQVYLNELSRELFTRNEAYLEYFFEEVVEKNGKNYIVAMARDKNFCTKLMVRVYDWSGIEVLKNGETKKGARLEGLEFASLKKGGNVEFMYQGVTEVY